MAALTTVAPRLSKLIPRLATDHDGEVLATVAAIRRTLEGAGLDLHALAAVLSDPSPAPRPKAPRRAPRKKKSKAPDPMAEVAIWCRDNEAGRLNPREREFIHDMIERLHLWGDLTEKQAAWLHVIHAKLQRGSAS